MIGSPRCSLATPLLAIALVLTMSGQSALAQSTPGSAGAKKASKCQQVVSKANGKYLSARLKRIAACSNAVLACVQTASDDAKCLGKATGKCRKQLGTPGEPIAFDDTLDAAIGKACDAVPLADLLDASVLGFGDVAATCDELGVAPLTSASDVARCLRLAHARTSEEAAGVEVPRAGELVAQSGIGAGIVDGLPLFGGCGSCGTDPPAAAKAVTACAASVSKAGAAFVAGTRTALDKCSAAFVKCAQEKPDDAGCLTKATATCGKVPVGLAKARTKLQGVVRKKCGGALAFATLEQPSGINLDALTCACQQVGVEPVLGIDDYAVCLARQHECALAALLPTVVPGLDALLAAQGIAVGDLLCEPATARSALVLPPAGARIFTPPFGGISKFMKNVFPAALKTTKSPLATRGLSPRVGAPFGGKCAPGPGRHCTFRLPISKKPTLSKNRAAPRAAEPPSLIVAVRRADGEFVADHYELPLGDTSVDSEVQLDVEYADDLASCAFELALSVMEDGEVASYTTIEQQPHVPPTNDSCETAKPLAANPYFELLDATAASTPDRLNPSCTDGGLSRTVWYSFTPDANGILAISTVGSSYDTLIAVYDRCGGNELACANDAVQDALQIPVVAGTPYLIEVANTGDLVPPTATLQLSAVFLPQAIGSPATISQLLLGTPVVNSPLCQTNVSGTEFPITITYADPTGNVVDGAVFQFVLEHFEPSQREEVGIPTGAPVLTGDVSNGKASFGVCGFFGTDTAISFKVRLATFGGLSNQLVGALPRPPGAN